MLDRSYIATQAATNMMPDEQQDEDSGTKGVRAMIAESAKLVKVFATAESKPKDSKIRHIEDEQRLAHENTPDESRLEHEAVEIDDAGVLQHEESGGGVSLQHEGDSKKPENRQHEADYDSGGSSPNIQDSELDTTSPHTMPTAQPKIDNKVETQLDHKIEKHTTKAEKLKKQIEKAEAKIPKQKVKISKLVHDEQTGTAKRKISFADEKVDKADAKWNQGESHTLSANAGRYVTGHASTFVHGKISETENLTGNTGVKAAHKGEQAVVKTYQTAKKIHRYVKNRPYRRLQHLKAKEAQNKGKLAYNQLLKDRPELRKKSKTASRLIQKRRIKREYAAAFRAAQNGGATAGALGKVGAVVGVGAAAVSGDGKALAKMGAQLGLKIAFKKAGMALAKAAAPLLLKIGLVLLIIGAILLLFTMCVSLLSTATGYVLDSVSYQADADAITEYSVYMTQLEVELKEEIMEAAADLEGLHEFRFVLNSPSGGVDVIFEGVLAEEGLGHPYNTPPVYDPPDFNPLVLLAFFSDITHDPFELMAYLTVLYGNFYGYDINAILREIFDTAFELEINEGYEERSATVEAWHYDVEGNRIPPYTETMYYNWYYREVVLTVHMTISEVLQDRMTEEQQEHHAMLMETLGLRQFVGSPFEDNWLSNVSSPFGYRFHPITLVREMHNGIDIALPEGTPILSGAPGTVTFAGYITGYGNTVIIEYIDEERGMGVRLLYAHMEDIDVAIGDTLEMGAVIGTVGQTGVATGPHLHMEVQISEDGGAWRLINPLFFVQPYVS